MIDKLLTYFGWIGTASVALWLLALIASVLYLRPGLRSLRLAYAVFIMALASYYLSGVNSGNVATIEVSEQPVTADPNDPQRLKLIETLRKNSANINFAEDNGKDKLDIGAASESELHAVEGKAMDAKPADWRDGRKKQKRAPDAKRSNDSNDISLENLDKKPGAAKGPAASQPDDTAADQAPSVKPWRVLTGDQKIEALTWDSANIFMARLALILGLAVIAIDYLRRFNTTNEPIVPLPINSTYADRLFPKTRSVYVHKSAGSSGAAPGPSEFAVKFMERVAQKGETFVYMGPTDPWPGTFVSGSALGGRYRTVTKFSMAHDRQPFDKDIAFESAWHGHACLAVAGREAALDFLENQLVPQIRRRKHIERAPRTFHIAWDFDAPIPADAASLITRLSRDANLKLIVSSAEPISADLTASFEEIFDKPQAIQLRQPITLPLVRLVDHLLVKLVSITCATGNFVYEAALFLPRKIFGRRPQPNFETLQTMAQVAPVQPQLAAEIAASSSTGSGLALGFPAPAPVSSSGFSNLIQTHSVSGSGTAGATSSGLAALMAASGKQRVDPSAFGAAPLSASASGLVALGAAAGPSPSGLVALGGLSSSGPTSSGLAGLAALGAAPSSNSGPTSSGLLAMVSGTGVAPGPVPPMPAANVSVPPPTTVIATPSAAVSATPPVPDALAGRIIFYCSSCSKKLAVKESSVGKSIACPHCSTQNLVPAQSAPPIAIAGLPPVAPAPVAPPAAPVVSTAAAAAMDGRITFPCITCGKKLAVKTTSIGKSITCPNCQTSNPVPNQSPAAVPTPAAAIEPAPVAPAPTVAATPAPIAPAPIVAATPAPIASAPTVEVTPAPIAPAPIVAATPAPIASAPTVEVTPAPIAPAPVIAATPAPIAPAPTVAATPAPIAPAPIVAATPAPIAPAPIITAPPATATPAPPIVPPTPAPLAPAVSTAAAAPMEGRITFPCITCGKKLAVKATSIGKSINCPNCQTSNPVPAQPPIVSPAPSAPMQVITTESVPAVVVSTISPQIASPAATPATSPAVAPTPITPPPAPIPAPTPAPATIETPAALSTQAAIATQDVIKTVDSIETSATPPAPISAPVVATPVTAAPVIQTSLVEIPPTPAVTAAPVQPAAPIQPVIQPTTPPEPAPLVVQAPAPVPAPTPVVVTAPDPVANPAPSIIVESAPAPTASATPAVAPTPSPVPAPSPQPQASSLSPAPSPLEGRIQFFCSKCQKKLAVKTASIGKSITCPSCQTANVVPAESQSVPPPVVVAPAAPQIVIEAPPPAPEVDFFSALDSLRATASKTTPAIDLNAPPPPPPPAPKKAVVVPAPTPAPAAVPPPVPKKAVANSESAIRPALSKETVSKPKQESIKETPAKEVPAKEIPKPAAKPVTTQTGVNPATPKSPPKPAAPATAAPKPSVSQTGVNPAAKPAPAAPPSPSKPKPASPDDSAAPAPDADQSIVFRCVHCSKKLKVKVAFVGKKIKCAACSGVVEVPETSSVP